jgi:MoxR-like ATPase
VRGPVFANMILADEINRTPPKTQAALLEAMQEHQVTAAGVHLHAARTLLRARHAEPIEMEGTYPLPEAQLDRFMFNVVMDYLPRTTKSPSCANHRGNAAPIEALFTGEDVLRFHGSCAKCPSPRRCPLRRAHSPPRRVRTRPNTPTS